MSAIDDALDAIRNATYGEEVRGALIAALSEALNIRDNVEVSTNKVTEIDSNSTDTQYASAKAIYDALENKLSSAAGAVKTANIDTGAVTEAKLATALKNTLYRMDTETQNVGFAGSNPKTIYLNAVINDSSAFNGQRGIIITSAENSFQFFFGRNKLLLVRYRDSESSYTPWEDVCQSFEKSSNKKTAINSSNQASTAFFPSIKAVVDYLTANYIGNGSGTVTENNLATALKNSLYRVDNTTENVIYSADNPRIIYTNARVNGNKPTLIFTLGDDSQLAMCKDGHLYCRTYANGAYGSWIDLKATSIGESNKTSGAYPTVQAVYNFVTAFVASAISGKANTSDVNTALTEKENTSDKLTSGEAFSQNKTSPEKYLSALAAYQYGLDHYTSVEDMHYLQSSLANVEAYIGYTESDILGLQVDFVNSRFTRLAGAEGLEAGSDFDDFPMFGGRRRCCVANDGTINAYYGEQGYTEDGTNGQVMVYQPKFYYRMVPLKLEKQASGLGYHIRKANYYVTANPHPGFKLHPLFYDANGKEIDYVLLSAYEGSMYDVSESAYVNDSVDTSVSYGTGDLLCSVAGKKPISGKLTGVGTKSNFETMAQTRGSGWHLSTIKAENANQLLMMIELGTLNSQTAIGRGVVDQSGASNASSLTGSTASLGNATGMATETIAESAGTETANTTNGKLSVSYRGVENPWGNIWKHINGINIWGDGTMNGGQVFICDDFSFNESKYDGNYQSAGFTISNSDGYVSAFGYGDEEFDWLFMPSETTGNNALPVGDYFWRTSNLNGYRIARLGGLWDVGNTAGGFCWGCSNAPGYQYYNVGGRLLYVPTA